MSLSPSVSSLPGFRIPRLLFACFACFAGLFLTSAAFTGCSTPPSQRQTAATTLKVVGLTAKATVDSAALLLRDGKLSPEQWSRLAAFYDLKFQPAYQLAVATARADLNSAADPQLLALAAQLAALAAEATR